MSNFDAEPVNLGASYGANFSSDVRVADPFTASNLTWTEIEDSTSSAWGGFWFYHGLTVGRAGMVLVAVGGVGSEVIIASFPAFNATAQGFKMFVPIPVASGSRISLAASMADTSTIRCQLVGVKSSAFDAVPTWTVMESGPYDLEDNLSTYGKGPSIDPGASSNTKGSYTELSVTGTNSSNNVLQGDSIGADYDYFGTLAHDNYNVSASNAYKLLDVATGAVSSEVISMGDVHHRTNGSESLSTQVMWDPGGISTGTRVSARAQADDTDATDRLVGVTMFGLR
jgi:hypothetical protein